MQNVTSTRVWPTGMKMHMIVVFQHRRNQVPVQKPKWNQPRIKDMQHKGPLMLGTLKLSSVNYYNQIISKTNRTKIQWAVLNQKNLSKNIQIWKNLTLLNLKLLLKKLFLHQKMKFQLKLKDVLFAQLFLEMLIYWLNIVWKNIERNRKKNRK